MTLLGRETQPLSEAQTIVRYHYLYNPPAIAGAPQEPTTITKELIVVGCGVNYDANRGVGEPRWLASDAALTQATEVGVAFKSKASPLEIALPASADLPLRVTKNGRSVSCQLIGSAGAAAQKIDAQTARYADVFPDTDLEWRVGNGFLKESLILRSHKAPTEFTALIQLSDLAFLVFDATQSTYTALAAGAKLDAVRGPLLLADLADRAKRRLLIPRPFVVDAKGRRSMLDCSLKMIADGLVEYHMRIPENYLAHPALAFPLTVDPPLINVTDANKPSVYEAGKTYFISGTIWYSTQQVRIEANAILKYDPEYAPDEGYGYLYFDGSATVRVEGTPYNYAVFTSAYDDSVGLNTDEDNDSILPDEHDPSPADYWSAIVIGGLAGTNEWDAVVRYAKFAYASEAIYFLDTTSDPRKGRIEFCVFRNNHVGVCVQINESSTTCEINDCLFVGPQAESPPDWGTHWGVRFCCYDDSPSVLPHTLRVTNCTFDYFSWSEFGDDYPPAGIVIDDHNADTAEYTILRNVFAHCEYGVYSIIETGWPQTNIDRNGFSNCVYDFGGDLSGTNNYHDDAPFDVNANGSYYLKSGAGHPFVNGGGITPQAAGLSTRTTTVPNIRQTHVTINETWYPVSRDDDSTVDLGYHYDPVDVIIQNGTIGVSAELVIAPSVVIAFSHWMDDPQFANITIQSAGCLDMRGTGQEPIRVSSTLLCGDEIGRAENNPPTAKKAVPGDLSYPLYNGILFYDRSLSSKIHYVTFEGADHCIEVAAGSDWQEVIGCRFSQCVHGIVSMRAMLVQNCLFRNTAWAGIFLSGATGVEIRNCTLTSCTLNGPGAFQGAIHLTGQTGGPIADATIVNCILTSSPAYGIFRDGGVRPAVEDYNCFFHNGPGPYDRDTNFGYGPNDKQGHPQFLSGEPPVPDLYERFYLDQDHSPCVNAGRLSDVAFMSTARDGFPDVRRIDIGYHYLDNPKYRGEISWTGEITEIKQSPNAVIWGRPWQLRDGSIVAVYMTAGSIKMARSYDYGKSWAEDPKPVYQAGANCFVSDPYVIELSSGDLLCSFYEHEWADGALLEYSRCCRIRLRKTDANGQWQHFAIAQEDYSSGDQIVPDGTFESEDVWTFPGGWSWDSGRFARANNASYGYELTSADTTGMDGGATYLAMMRVTVVSGAVGIRLYEDQEVIYTSNSGMYCEEIRIDGNSDGKVYIAPSSFTGTVDDVVVFQVSPQLVANGAFDSSDQWSWGNGWAWDSEKKNAQAQPSTTAELTPTEPQPAIEGGRTYLVRMTVSHEAGGVGIQLFDGQELTFCNTSGVYFYEAVVTGEPVFAIVPDSGGFQGSVDNVLVVEKRAEHQIWSVWDSTLLERDDGGLICFFSRQGALAQPGLFDDEVDGKRPYGAARVFSNATLPATMEPPIVQPPIVVCRQSNPNPPYEESVRHMGMCNAVQLPDGKILAVLEYHYDSPLAHLGIVSIKSVDTQGKEWPTVAGNRVVYNPPQQPNQRQPSAGGPNLVEMSDGRLVCLFNTDEDWPNSLGGADYMRYSDVKAVVSGDFGESWDWPVIVISQKDATPPRYCSWPGTARLMNDSLICTFNDGPPGAIIDCTFSCTTANFRPAMFADDFDDQNAKGWSGQSPTWEVKKGAQGVDWNYEADSPGLTLAGLPDWSNYEMSAQLVLFSGEAGMVFHADVAGSFYYLAVDSSGCTLWKYTQYTGSPLASVEGPFSAPIELRMTRLANPVYPYYPRFLCYANGTPLDYTVGSGPYWGGKIGLRVETGNARFDNVKVHGANAFLDTDTGYEEPSIEDDFNHRNLEGTPFMWGLLGEWELVESTAAGHGWVLQSTWAALQTPKAFRGDSNWTDYAVHVEFDLGDSGGATQRAAGICLRIQQAAPEYFYYCVVHYQSGTWKLSLYRSPSAPDPIGQTTLPNFTAAGWHSLSVEAKNDTEHNQVDFDCYLDGVLRGQFSDSSAERLESGTVGLMTTQGTVRYDNFMVLDLRQY